MIDNLTEATRLLNATQLMLLGKDNQPISDLYYALQIAVDAIEELQERREADRWNVIHTEADLPKESDNYLIQLDNNWNEQLTAFFSKGIGFCFMGSVLKDVIAWKPLPEPYTESEEK